MKKILVLFLMFIPLMASAEPVEIDGIYYNLVSKAQIAEVTRSNSSYYSGEVIIPLRCDVRIFEGMAELLRTINDVNNTLNPQLTIAGFLVTHVNRELRSTPVNLKEIHTCYGNKVFQTLIPNNDDLLVYYKQFATELSA